MMRKVFLIIFIIIYSYACSSNSDSCKRIHTGQFYYFIAETGEKVIINHTDSSQTETFSKSNHSSLPNKIFWQTDCSYKMYIRTNVDSLHKTDSLLAQIPANVEIIHIGDTFYVCTTSLMLTNKFLFYRDTIYFNK